MHTTDEVGVEHLRFERRGLVGWCTVDRPAARNALTPAMYRGLGRALQLVNDDPELAALVLTGVDEVFISGGELGLTNDDAPGVGLPFGAFRWSPAPIVVAVNGLCHASGLLFTMLADVAVVSDRATFRAPELHRGYPDMWFASVLPALVGTARARDLMLTARTIDAHDAERFGLVARVVPHEALVQETNVVVEQILRCAPSARTAWRREVAAQFGAVDEMTTATALASPEVAEGFRAFKERRVPSWAPRIP